MFDSFKRERNVRRALQAIAKQRVAMVLQPGNVLVVENSPIHTESFDIAVRTAHIRGWVEVLWDGLPSGQVETVGSQLRVPTQMTPKTHYRLTEGGWSVIHGTHAWTVSTFVVSLLALIASVLATVLVLPK